MSLTFQRIGVGHTIRTRPILRPLRWLLCLPRAGLWAHERAAGCLVFGSLLTHRWVSCCFSPRNGKDSFTLRCHGNLTLLHVVSGLIMGIFDQDSGSPVNVDCSSNELRATKQAERYFQTHGPAPSNHCSLDSTCDFGGKRQLLRKPGYFLNLEMLKSGWYTPSNCFLQTSKRGVLKFSDNEPYVFAPVSLLSLGHRLGWRATSFRRPADDTRSRRERSFWTNSRGRMY